MWRIIVFYIVIFKLPVTPNQFQYRSVANMTNIHRTKVMLPVELVPPEPAQLLPNHKPTTCIAVAGRYEGGIYRGQETVCNTVQRRPETRRQVTPTTQMLRYSRVLIQMPPRQLGSEPPGMIKSQMMLPKQSNNNPQNVARTPQVMMPKLLLRASLRPGQLPSHAVKRQPDYHPIEGNRDFQEYQLFPQVLPSDNRNKDHQEYQSDPRNVYLNDGNQQVFYPKSLVSSTSTSAPIPFILTQTLPDRTTDQSGPPEQSERPEPSEQPVRPERPETRPSGRSTTSTMPPFPGGFIPGGGPGGFSGESPQVCGGKAKCNQYLWTTRKKPHKRTTEEFLLWTP